MSETMYAVKKSDIDALQSATLTAQRQPPPNHPSTSIKSAPKLVGTTANDASSQWHKKAQKPKRKKRKKKRRKSSSSAGDVRDRDGDDAKSESYPAPSSEGSPSKSASYDPASNPYALENYKRNAELQKKTEKTSMVSAVTTTTTTTKAVESAMTKSPLSQVRLTPLFPSPDAGTAPNRPLAQQLSLNFHGQQLLNQQPPRVQQHFQHQQYGVHGHVQHGAHHGGPRHHQHHQHQQHQHQQYSRAQHQEHMRQQFIAQHGQQHPEHCPHGNLSAEELINIKIRKRTVCYVVGLPIHVATEQKLRAQEWFGQFGPIATIAINRNQKSIQANSIPAHITYDNPISALNAINFCNKFVFDDGRKLKATWGTQHYCRWFIAANKKCTNVFCGFRHSWCRPEDVITQKDINEFKAIPAGAYTSRNIENQPLGVRSDTFNHASHTLPGLVHHHIAPQQTQSAGPSPNIATLQQRQSQARHSTPPPVLHHGVHGQVMYAQVPVPVPVQYNPAAHTFERIGHIQPTPTAAAQLQTETEGDVPTVAPLLNVIPPAPPAVSNGISPEAPNAVSTKSSANAKEITFWVSNSALTPKALSPMSPMTSSFAGVAASGIPVLSALEQAQAQQGDVERERLIAQVKALSEREAKNRAEMERWWAQLKASREAERAATAKYEKVRGELETLEAKHDSLQIRYLALTDEMKALRTELAQRESNVAQWTACEVAQWMCALEGGKFGGYAGLKANVQTENVDGRCLSSLDKGDLHRLGVTDFKHKKELLAHIRTLVEGL